MIRYYWRQFLVVVIALFCVGPLGMMVFWAMRDCDSNPRFFVSGAVMGGGIGLSIGWFLGQIRTIDFAFPKRFQVRTLLLVTTIISVILAIISYLIR